MPRMLLCLLGMVLTVTACTGSADTTTTGSTATTLPPAPTSTSEAVISTTRPTTTTVDSSSTSTTSQAIHVTIEGGDVTGPDRFDFTVGDEVSVWVLSDVAAQIHVHGYDLFVEAQAGVPVEIALTADVPGIFEVELEASHTLLFELQVTP